MKTLLRTLAAFVLAVATISTAYAKIPQQEREALITLYKSTNGDEWIDNTNWNGPAGTECLWHGVGCDPSRTTVTGIHLYSDNLNGTIPQELGNLNNLQVLELDSNQLMGAIPSELGNLTNLQGLYLSRNQLTGAIPSELGNLTILQDLYLRSNQLTGGIPSELGKLNNLQWLFLDSNALVGEIPSELMQLISLEAINFHYNGLYTSDPNLLVFLNSKHVWGDWQSKQTIAPIIPGPPRLTPTSIQLAWQPIAYNWDPGGYEVYYANTSGGPYTLYETTSNKSVDNLIITGLDPNTTYYFRLRTATYRHPLNPNNDVYSEYTDEVTATTIREGFKWGFPAGIITFSSPAIGPDGTIYVGSWYQGYYGGLFAIRADGSLKWVCSTGGEINSSPSISADGLTVYVGSGNKLYAVNAANGDPRWIFNTGLSGLMDFSPAIGRDGTIYFGLLGAEKFFAINPDGTESWSSDMYGWVSTSAAIGYDSTIYVGTQYPLHAFNPDGSIKGVSGLITCSSPAIGADGMIYLTGYREVNSSKTLYFQALNPTDISIPEWFIELSQTDEYSSSPAIGPDGKIYVGVGNNLYVIDPVVKKIERSYQINGYIFSPPAIARDGTIWLGSADGNIYAIGPDGSVTGIYETGAGVWSSPAIANDGTVIVGSTDGNLYAIEGSSSLANSAWPMFQHDLYHTGRASHAATVIDQMNIIFTDTSSGCGISPEGNKSQSFTSSVPLLDAVDLRLRTGGNFLETGYETSIRIRSGSPSGVVIGTASTFISGPKSTGKQLDVLFEFSPPMVLIPGNTYAIEWVSPEAGGGILTWMIADGNPYPGGTAFNCAGIAVEDWDFVFATHTSENTTAGNNIVVQPIEPITLLSPVTITFDQVLEPGVTKLATPEDDYPVPEDFKTGQPHIIYDLTTTAVFSGSCEVCIDFGGITFNDETKLELFHHGNDGWEEVTSYLEVENKKICGLVNSLSVFSIFEPDDNIPPQIVVTVSKSSLWPPNHKMVDVGFSYEVIDNWDQDPEVSIEVTSDESTATAPGAAGSDHAPDAEITDNGRILLRAERSGEGDGRVYQIVVIAKDESNNSSSESLIVKVNSSKKKDAVDSGQNYDATEIN